MSNKIILTDDIFSKLFKKNDNEDKYKRKRGKEYLMALEEIFNFDNRNDKPLTDDDIKVFLTENNNIKNFMKFEYLKDVVKKHFIHSCNLSAEKDITYTKDKLTIKNRNNEKLIEKDITNEELLNKIGVCYIITYDSPIDNDEIILKIGQTRKSWNERLRSYNCGTIKSRVNGTCSTTNFKILQSAITLKKDYHIYICDIINEPQTITYFDVQSAILPDNTSLALENIMLKLINYTYKKYPILNIQTDINNKTVLATDDYDEPIEGDD